MTFRVLTEAEHQDHRQRLQAFMDEKIDTSHFSERMQNAIRELEATKYAYETDLEYLRRMRPDMPDDARVAYMLWSAIIGKPIRGN